MPSPRAILRDIAEFGLDPTKPYTRISSSGRLGHDGHGQPVHSVDVPFVAPKERHQREVPVPHVEVKLEVKADGTVEEKVKIEVGTLKMEVEVPVKTDEGDITRLEEAVLADAPGPDVSDEELVVVASSKKLKAKKAEKADKPAPEKAEKPSD